MTEARLAVLIDADNAQTAIIGNLLAEIAKFGVATARRIYGDFTSQQLASWRDNRELTLHRGHWFEAGIASAFHANRTPLLSQVEIAFDDGGVPIRAHLDFVLLRGGPKPAVRVLKLKSMKRIPAALYPAHEAQLYGQIGLLAKQWAKPVFALQDYAGGVRFSGVSFPDLVRNTLGIDLPENPRLVDLQGWVLAVSMTEAKPFGPYVPEPTMLSLCRKTANLADSGRGSLRSHQP